MTKTVKAPQRAPLAHKLGKYIRASPVHYSGLKSSAFPTHEHLVHGGAPKSRITNKTNTWYPADDDKVHFKRKRVQPKKTTGRKSITPGSIVILLAGDHRGRRVVVLDHLPNNYLLVTGPYKVNGVPLSRVNAAYVIATSQKVALDGVKVALDQKFFERPKGFSKHELKEATQVGKKKNAALKQAAEAKRTAAKATQKAVDAALLTNINKVEHLKAYLSNRFTLYNSSRPHELKF